MSDQIVTHYVPYFTEPHRDRSLRTAVCGRVIAMADHSVTPDCPKCQAWIDADVKEAEGLVKQWDQEVRR